MILCKREYNNLVNKIIKEGNEVNGTYELTGVKVDFAFSTTSSVKAMLGISDEFERDFIQSISTFTSKELGPYITEKYFLLIPALKEAVMELENDCNETRRAVITFPKEHCFQSIQFLVRDNTVNIVCFMRSCNAVKNLPGDAWLCYKLADMFGYYMNQTGKGSPYEYHKVIMMFGSLHVFKDQVTDVL